VSNRTGIAPGKTVLAVEKALLKFIPKPYLINAHHWLILHGRYVCVARNPKCDVCSIADLCDYKYKHKKAPVVKSTKATKTSRTASVPRKKTSARRQSGGQP
jgi:adenine-specific DNA glycosylase